MVEGVEDVSNAGPLSCENMERFVDDIKNPKTYSEYLKQRTENHQRFVDMCNGTYTPKLLPKK